MATGGRSLVQLAALIGVLAGGVTIWQVVKPKVLRPRLNVELGVGVVTVLNAETSDPVAGARIYIEPIGVQGRFAGHWITDANGSVWPVFQADWPPVQNVGGTAWYEFWFVAEKPGYQPGRAFVRFPASPLSNTAASAPAALAVPPR